MVAFLPTNLFIKVDLPTFGIPMIKALYALDLSPLDNLLSFNSFNISLVAKTTSFIPLIFNRSTITTLYPLFSYIDFIFLVLLTSHRSVLVIIIIFGLLLIKSSISLILEEIGILAST